MLSTTQKMSIRRHLGYPNLETNMAISLGFPSVSHPAFVLQYNMDHLLPEAEPKCLQLLEECDAIECQLSDARTRIMVKMVNQIQFAGPQEIAILEDQYTLWTKKLADHLGAVINPFSMVHQRGEWQLICED